MTVYEAITKTIIQHFYASSLLRLVPISTIFFDRVSLFTIRYSLFTSYPLYLIHFHNSL